MATICRLIASLIVLLDGEWALQAELAFYDNPPDAKRNPVLRQAKNIVARGYDGAGETTTISILESHSRDALTLGSAQRTTRPQVRRQLSAAADRGGHRHWLSALSLPALAVAFALM